MTQFKIFDNDGKWVVNQCPMAMNDGTRQLRFDPQVPCKVKVEGWVERQLAAGVLALANDPSQPEPAAEDETNTAKAKGSRSGK